MTLLGQQAPVPDHYSPELLDTVPRAEARKQLGLGPELPFVGEDIWHAWELGWLGPGGAPRVGVGRLAVPCDSPCLIESKSLKLYLNSLNPTRFESEQAVKETLEKDLGAVAGAPVSVAVLGLNAPELAPCELPGACIDGEFPEAQAAAPDPGLLRAKASSGEQVLHSHVLRSLCPVTAQPDWASVVVRCQDVQIAPSSLLTYIHAFRAHREFHEHCVERMFCDIQQACRPRALSIQALYTRRGGLDINPWRSTETAQAPRLRSIRQ